MEVLFSISLALVAGLLVSRLIKPLKLPAVTGYLIAGILIGPYCLGRLSLPEGFDLIGLLHSTEGIEALGIISQVALMMANEFSIAVNDIPDDATDALALALCHGQKALSAVQLEIIGKPI